MTSGKRLEIIIINNISLYLEIITKLPNLVH